MAGILITLVAVQAAGYIALQFPAVQTWGAKRIIGLLSENIDGKIDIGKIHIVFFNRFIIQDISITSTETSPHLDSLKRLYHQSDTLLSCRKLSVTLSPAELLKLKIKLSAVKIERGVFNLQNEGDSLTNLSRIFRIDRNRQKDTTKKSSLNLLANSLRIKDFRFTLNNPDKYVTKGDSTINFSDLSISDIDVNLNNIRIERDTLFGTVKNISGTDKSGFRLATLKCDVEVSGTEARLKNLLLEDEYSQINAHYFSMRYSSPKDLSDFVNSVILGADFDNSYLNFKTIGKIAPVFQDSRLAFFFTGEVKGPVANIRTPSLTITSESGQTVMDVGVKLIGLPDVPQTMALAKVNSCHTTSQDIARIVSSIHDSPESPFFSMLAPHIRYDFQGGFAGLLNDFVANGEITSTAGDINIDVLLKSEKEKNGMLLQGKIRTLDLDVGRILSNKMIGEVSLQSSLSALIRPEEYGGIDLRIDSVKIDKAGFNGYDYSNILAVGKYNNDEFDGRIISHDPNLDFIFQGLFSFNQKARSQYNFYADIPYANLAALNIDKRDSISEVSLHMTANFTRTPERDIIGSIDIKNSDFTNSAGSFNIGPVKLKAYRSENEYITTLTAPFAQARYYGTAPFSSFIKKTMALTLGEHLDKYFTEPDYGEARQRKDEFRFFIETFNTRNIFAFLMPELYIQDSTRLEAHIDTTDRLNLFVRSGRVAFNRNYIKGLDFSLNNRDSLLRLDVSGKSVRAAGFEIGSARLQIAGGENTLRTSFGFRNDTSGNNRGEINAVIRFMQDTVYTDRYAKNMQASSSSPHNAVRPKARRRNTGVETRLRTYPKIRADIENSRIDIKGDRWTIRPSTIIWADSTLYVNNFSIANNSQTLKADGVLSGNETDSLNLDLDNFDLDILNLFTKKPFGIQGRISGNAAFSSVGKNPGIFLDLQGDSVYVNNCEAGTVKLMSQWNPEHERFDIAIGSRLHGTSPLDILGYYRPDSSYIDLNASLNELSVIYFEPFLSDLISQTGGSLSGNLKLYGTLGQTGNTLELIGNDTRFNNFKFKVNFTQVSYTLNGPITLDENGLSVRNADIADPFGGRGKVNGGLKYRHFQNIQLDTRLDFNNFQCLNTTDRDNESFYGSAFATGSLRITGPLQKINMDIRVLSDANTSIHIPLSDAATAQQTNLLTFVTPKIIENIDPYDTLSMARPLPKQPTELNIGLSANVTPEAEILIEINKSLGDVIKANGTGLINMDINPTKEIFDVFGDYTINQGSYKFVLMGFAAKDFIIQSGGTINFNGDIFNTNLNLTAVYRTKASINTLVADTSSVSTRRTVNCEIGMSGQLTNPQLTFNIDIPDLDPTTKMKVESALNTDGKIQKQFAALLISGGFIPDEQSGIANNSTILYSNVSEILSNQLNNIFQQLNIPLDLGLNYQPGDKGSDIFDVAVSTQLFNNRVLINGNIGNDPYASTNNRDVIGNIDVEVKLDQSGKLRLTLFSHAADQYSNYLDDSQRSGIGFVYQQRFNTFRELFRKKSDEQKAYEKQKKDAERRLRRETRKYRKAQVL